MVIKVLMIKDGDALIDHFKLFYHGFILKIISKYHRYQQSQKYNKLLIESILEVKKN